MKEKGGGQLEGTFDENDGLLNFIAFRHRRKRTSFTLI